MKYLLRAATTTVLVLVITALVGLPPVNAGGGIDRKMTQTFNAMSTHTNPQISMGAQRGVIYGGSLQIRNKIMDVSVMSYDPPSLKFGCGGWDLYAGSFSFISSAQITQMLRSIASATAAYFFKLALGTISKEIESHMSELWNKMTDINSMQLNSCKIGESLANIAFGKGEQIEGEGKGRQVLAALGFRSDASDAGNQGRQESSASQASSTVPAMKDEIVTGNVVWKALNNQDAGGSWFQDADRSLIEQIMSITGTLVICVPGEDNCPKSNSTLLQGEQRGLETTPYAPTLRLQQLVKGVNDADSVRVYRCNDSQYCLDPKAISLTSFRGTEAIILDIMLGSGRNMGEGLIGKHASAAEPLSSSERAFIANGGHYVTMAMALAIHSEWDARNFAEQYSEVMAAEITAKVVDEMFAVSAQAASVTSSSRSREAQDLIVTGRRAMADDLLEFYQNSVTNTDIFTYFNMKLNRYEKPNLPINFN